tara:strand:- start:886 stop:1116 length:231 start_codon:yes stop_codon:yes gene_type:complete
MVEKQKEKPLLTVDGKGYKESELNEEQKLMINHIGDLERKISSSQFNLQQLQFGKQAFADALKASLAKEAEVKPEK